MVEMVDPDLGDTIFDPAAGTGGFLIDAVEYIPAKYSAEPQRVPIYGEEWLEKASDEQNGCRPSNGTGRDPARRFPIGSCSNGRSMAST